MSKLIIIDGYSLLFRVYFATAYPGVEIMRNQDGIPTNAIFAFSNMINKILSSMKEGEGLMVALDTGGTTFRKDSLESYKANRKPTPEDLKIQFPIAREFLKSINVFFFEKEGFEGDDVAGSVAKLAEKEGYDVEIYTSDKDYIQLVSDKITVNLIRKGLSDVVPLSPTAVKEMFGFDPIQIIDYKGLRGDPSDNLPGINGIGEKTAVKLIQEYGSFDNIIAHKADFTGKVAKSIEEGEEAGRLSRDLAMIKTDIELPFDISDTIYQGYTFEEVNTFCQKYGLKQFINKVNPKWKKGSASTFDMKVNVVESFEHVELNKDIGIAIDFLGDYFRDEIEGIAISTNDNVYYEAIEDIKKDKKLLNILTDGSYKKYCYDYKAIDLALSKLDIKIEGLEFDILIASYLLDSSLKNNPDQVMNLFGIDISDEQEEVSLFTSQNPNKTAKIAYYSLYLAGKVKAELSKIEALNLYNDLELPLVITLAKIEKEGFPLDKEKLDQFGDTFKKKANQLQEEIFEMVGEKFNLASPKQLGDILFNKLGLKSNKKMSTSFDNLKELIGMHPVIEKLIEYRKYFKLITTYIDGLKPHIYEDGKIHAHFNQALTATGRLSSSNPNLQNISVRDEEGKLIRQAFYYPNNEYSILSLDYSQIELRVLAHLSNCKALQDIFKSNEDIHTATAKKVFHLDHEPTNNERRKAKAVNFGIIYGISDWGLADQIGCSMSEARDIISSFYDSFPEIKDFFFNIVEDAKKKGYVSTMFGRRRYLRELHDTNYQVREFAKRAAMNAPIQGTAADLIKIAMIKVDEALAKGGYKSKMVLQIHDELIFKVPEEEKESVYNLVKTTMEHCIEMNVPLEVDGGFGVDWYSAK